MNGLPNSGINFTFVRMRKSLLFLSTFLFSINILIAQSNVVSAGSSKTTSNGSLSYTLGYISTKSSPGGAAVTAGLQHAYEIYEVTGVSEVTLDFKISVYPNPSVDELNLEIDKLNIANLTFQLFDINGKSISKEASLVKKSSIDMKPFASGTYLLVINQEKKLLKSYRVVKK